MIIIISQYRFKVKIHLNNELNVLAFNDHDNNELMMKLWINKNIELDNIYK